MRKKARNLNDWLFLFIITSNMEAAAFKAFFDMISDASKFDSFFAEIL